MSSVIINSLVPGKNVRTVALWQLYLALMPIPGVLLGAWLVNKIGRRWTGITGLLGGYVLIGFIIGGCYERLTTHSIPAFVVLYGLLQAYFPSSHIDCPSPTDSFRTDSDTWAPERRLA